MTTTSTGQYTDRRPPYRQLISQVRAAVCWPATPASGPLPLVRSFPRPRTGLDMVNMERSHAPRRGNGQRPAA